MGWVWSSIPQWESKKMGIQIPSNKLITIPQCGKTIQPIDHGSYDYSATAIPRKYLGNLDFYERIISSKYC
jgi:hypothetical protein